MNNVKDFGAVGDGIVNDTAAIQRAIDAGGTAYFPPGKYLTGTLFLRSNGGLELDPNAMLFASLDINDYNDPSVPRTMAGSKACGESCRHLIIADQVENVFIRGGQFNGRGQEIFKSREMIYSNTGLGPVWKHVVDFRPAQLMVFSECRRIRLNGFTILDATAWSCFLYGCEDATIDGIRIRNSPYIGENDGIDIDCCSHVTVSNCDIEVGDDAFTLRACEARLANPRPCEWVTISNCILRSAYAHAIRIGVGNGEIRHCSFSNISVLGSHIAIHVNAKYSGDDKATGAYIHDLAFRNFHVDVGQLAFVRLDYRFAEAPSQKSIRYLQFDNIDGCVRQPSALRGNGVAEISDINFSNINLRVLGDNTRDDNVRKFCMIEGTDGAFELTQAKNVNFFNTQLIYEHPECWKCDVAQKDCENVSFQSCRFPHCDK